MIEINTIGSLTEIYAGGGKFITEAYPTNFHTFHTRKVLLPSDSVDNYKEVTASQKAALEASDARYERPSQLFIDLWNIFAKDNGVEYGRYNEERGYFELNGITDIKYDEAFGIMSVAPICRMKYRQWGEFRFDYIQPNSANLRTLMPIRHGHSGGAPSQFTYYGFFAYWQSLSVIRIVNNNAGNDEFFKRMFYSLSNLREIRSLYGWTNSPRDAFRDTFHNCLALETCEIYNLGGDVSFATSPLLNYHSLNYMVERKNNMVAISVTLHPDAYARLTEELIERAAEKQITFVTT